MATTTTTTTEAGGVPPAGSAGAPPAGPRGRRRGGANRAGGQLRAGWLTYTILTVVALMSIFPLYFSAVAASHTNARLAEEDPPLWFGGRLWTNIEAAWDDGNMVKAMTNTTFVAGTITVSTVLFATLAGFAFAKLRFRARNFLMLLVIGTMMVPPQLTVVPLFMWVAELEWTDHLQAVILPMMVSAFGVFFMRQYLAQALPSELVEAARVDGANSLRIIWHVVFPAARPAMAVLAMLTFVMAWNEFFWPIIALTQQNPTVQVALTNLGRGYVQDQGIIMAGAQIVGGIMHGALKG
jgi:cellobiose transport system permease protein